MATTRGRWASPERTVVWTEPPPRTASFTRRAGGAAPPTMVAVVYYLSRNGQLDHPHFMEVTLSSPQDGLCLRHVLDRLNVLRGAGMADAYSWSSKRSYKSGYVWHDLTADDPVQPANGNEYVLKGSQLLLLPQLSVRPRDASASSSSSSSTSSRQGNDGNRMPPAGSRAARRKNWSSFDLGEYRVAAAVQMGAADAATQTDERRGRRRNAPPLEQEAARTELGSDEISPPPSSSSPDTLETLIQHDARLAAAAVAAPQPAEAYAGVISGGRMRASAVLMQLISCGSIPAAAKREGGGPSRRLARGRSDLSSNTAADGFSSSMSVGVGVSMEREYFSGILVETNKSVGAGVGGELGALKRSSSYNAARARDMNMMSTSAAGGGGSCGKLELAEEEVDGAAFLQQGEPKVVAKSHQPTTFKLVASGAATNRNKLALIEDSYKARATRRSGDLGEKSVVFSLVGGPRSAAACCSPDALAGVLRDPSCPRRTHASELGTSPVTHAISPAMWVEPTRLASSYACVEQYLVVLLPSCLCRFSSTRTA